MSRRVRALTRLRRDNATVALYVIKDDSEDDEEVARRKKEKEDREDRNK